MTLLFFLKTILAQHYWNVMIGFPSILEGIEDLNREQVEKLLARTKELKIGSPARLPLKRNISVATSFLENSTRTKLSFIMAINLLKGIHIDFEAEKSSLKKGESLEQTLLTLNYQGFDICIVRTKETKLLSQFKQRPPIKMINGGDGTNEHPTQALLDLYTLNEIFKIIKIMVRRRVRKRTTRSRRTRSKPRTRRQSLVEQIIRGLASPNYDIDEYQTGLLKEALDTSLATRNIAQNMKGDTDAVTKSIFQAHRKLNAKQNSVDQLKVIVSDKRDIAKKASSYLANLKSKVTADEIKRINAEKDLLKIKKAIDDITNATAELSPMDADTATFGLKATVIAKQASFDKAEIQFRSTEKLEAEAAKRSNEASRLLAKFETRFNQELSDTKRIKSNLKNNMKRISSAYADVKSLSLSLIDDAFSSETQSVSTVNIQETTVADTARRGRRFFFWS